MGAEAERVPALKRAQMFKAAIDSGTVDPHTYVGQMDNKAHRKGTPDGDAYHATKGNDKKRDVRILWAEKKYKESDPTHSNSPSFPCL